MRKGNEPFAQRVKHLEHKRLQVGIADQFGKTKECTERISINYYTI